MLTVKHSAKGFTRGLKFSVPRTDFSLLNLIEFNISSMAACHAPKIDNLQAYNTSTTLCFVRPLGLTNTFSLETKHETKHVTWWYLLSLWICYFRCFDAVV